jgi:hypothetical protein
VLIPAIPFLLLILGIILALLGIPFSTELTSAGVVLTLTAAGWIAVSLTLSTTAKDLS